MAAKEHPDPCLVLIFGASGDLVKRKLIPSLYELRVSGQLPPQFAVLGISRTSMSDDAYRDHLKQSAQRFAPRFDESAWAEFARGIYYLAADSTETDAYPRIKERTAQLTAVHQVGNNVLFYLAVAPHLYEPIIEQIGAHQMVTEGQHWCSLDRESPSWQRIIVEKPFGTDLESAAHLNRVVGRIFQEECIYRIDHYLGKETVQNLLVFRFANSIFEPIWTREFIDHVQITAAEMVGVEGRGGYYDSPGGGAMRDMIQSHLLQVMAIVAMEPPISLRADDIRVEKAKILSACRTPEDDQVPLLAVRGQYGPGQVAGCTVPGYRDAQGVRPDSQTETYAAHQVFVDTWRWGGVPFYLRSGKNLTKKLTEVVLTFKPTPHCLFRAEAARLRRNQIVINVQPDEGICIRFEGKVPGAGMNIRDVVMDFDYVEHFKAEPPEAYETLLLDAMRGDQTLYKHREEIEHCWRIVQPVLDHWQANPQDDLPNYAAGTWGPANSDMMLARDGRHWHNH